MHVVAIIVAAGQGLRFGGEIPKQFRELAGKPIFVHTLAKFVACPLVHEIVLIIPAGWHDFVENKLREFQLPKIQALVTGGKTRQESVLKGLDIVEQTQPSLVAIHDAVRPFVSLAKIEEVIRAGERYDAAILAVRPRDTIKQANDGFVEKTLPRERLRLVQTPQVFRFELLKKAFDRYRDEDLLATDDAFLVENAGARVKIVEGDYQNIKITEPTDFELAELILHSQEAPCV